MVTITWANIRSLIIFFGPILLPKAIAYYKTLRESQRRANRPVVPPPTKVVNVLFLLLVLSTALILRATPFFAPENLFVATQSRLQIPVDVLFNRVAAIRPDQTLTLQDESLRARFVNTESRLLYLQYGPEVLADCPFCRSDDPRSYFYYALPALLAPHVANLLVVAAATSFPVAGRHGAPWRSAVTVAAACLAALDVYAVDSFDPRANAKALRLGEVDAFHWRARAVRLVALAVLDAGLAGLVFLSSTNRAFAEPPGPAARVRDSARSLAAVRSKLAALGIVRNAAVRDETLRSKSAGYWASEVRLMGEVMEEREVVEGVNDAVGSGRVNIEKIERDAEEYAANVISSHQREKARVEQAPVEVVG